MHLRGWDKLTGTNNEKGWLQQEVETRDFYLELKRRTGRSYLTGADLSNAVEKLGSSRINKAWARRYGSDAEFDAVRDYLSRTAKRVKLQRLLLAVAGLMLVCLFLYAVWLSKTGERRARARELTAYAALSQPEDPPRALFLGWHAGQLLRPFAPGLERVLDSALFNGGSRATLRGHQDAVDSVAWSPDGKSLAYAGADQTVKLWDAGTGQELRTLRGHQWYVYSVAWSPDGKLLASAGNDGTIRIYPIDPDLLLNLVRPHPPSQPFQRRVPPVL